MKVQNMAVVGLLSVVSGQFCYSDVECKLGLDDPSTTTCCLREEPIGK